MIKIYINNFYKEKKIISKKKIEKIVKLIIKEEKLNKKIKKIEIGITLSGDELVWQLNKRFRGVDDTTDVLAFNIDDHDEHMLADVIISVDRAKEQAPLYDNTLEEELLLLIIHGVLHICGYNDEQEELRTIMKKKEEKILNNIRLLKNKGNLHFTR